LIDPQRFKDYARAGFSWAIEHASKDQLLDLCRQLGIALPDGNLYEQDIVKVMLGFWDENQPEIGNVPANNERTLQVKDQIKAELLSHLISREIAQIEHAKAYASDHADAGVPGHGQFLLIAKLADALGL
jgi:hypothetical protein